MVYFHFMDPAAVRPVLVCPSRGSMLSLLWRSLVALTGWSHLVTPFRLAFPECVPTVVFGNPIVDIRWSPFSLFTRGLTLITWLRSSSHWFRGSF